MKPFLITLCICFTALASAPAMASTIDLPASGQTACYDDQTGAGVACAGTGQDADLLAGVRWPDPRLTDNSDGTVTDNLTGLMWLKEANCIKNSGSGLDVDSIVPPVDDGNIFWPTALDFIAQINGGLDISTCQSYTATYTDWRLPNVNELKSLIDYDQNTSALPAAHPFTDVKYTYWTSTTHSNYRDKAFDVSMDYGLVSSGAKTVGGLNAAWPVRDSGTAGSVALPKTGQTKCYDAAGTDVACANTGQDAEFQKGVAWPVPRFADNGDGTVTDELTGLIWLADVTDCMGGTGDWTNALTTVADLNANPGTFHGGACSYTGNHDDWRLANIRELESIVHYDFEEEGATDTAVWLNALGVGFEAVGLKHWSSTSYDSSTDDAYAYNMAAVGTSSVIDKNSAPYQIWPVRGGVYGDPDISIAPTTVDFGSVTLGESTTQDVTVTNDGTYYLDVDATAALTAPFSITDDGCANQTLAPDGTCTITVGYDPTAEVASNGNANVTSDDPDEATVAVSLSGTGTTTTATPNSPPTAFELVSPADGATDLIMPVTMTWNATTDPDGDTVSYDINYCESSDFAGCTALENIASVNRESRWMKFAKGWITSLVTGPLSLMGCGGSATTASETPPSAYIATDLNPGTTYYWKVIANDPNGGVTESAVWSFTTR